jgi:hypothetical protein
MLENGKGQHFGTVEKWNPPTRAGPSFIYTIEFNHPRVELQVLTQRNILGIFRGTR